jgi:hypothetical protein
LSSQSAEACAVDISNRSQNEVSILRSDKRQKEELLEKTRKKIKNSEEATEKVKAIPEAIEQQQIEYEKSVRDFAELSESYESAN